MKKNLMIIRSIVIHVKPPKGLFKSRRKAEFEVWLDEKPLGRRMRPHWQGVLHLKQRHHIHDIQAISGMIVEAARDAIVSEDASLLVRYDTNTREFHKRDEVTSILTQKLAPSVEYLTQTNEAA
jgi:hypothetical protein